MTQFVMGSVVFTLVVLLLSAGVLGMRRLLLGQHHCILTVNSRMELPAITFQKLLPLLTDAGIPIPSTCGGAGTCGLCRVKILSGGSDPSPTELGRIAALDIEAGIRLACQVVVRENMSIEVPEQLFGIETVTCTVRSNRKLAPFMAEIALDLPAGQRMAWSAGSFIQVTAPAYSLRFRDLAIPPRFQATWERYGLRKLAVDSPSPTTRAYSLANRPGDEGLVLDIRLALPPPGLGVPPGVVSSYLFGAKPGTTVEVSGPYGSFGANESDREMIFIGGGAGMAPLRALIFDQLERKETRRRITFWYGARSRADVFYTEEFDQLQREHENFSWTVALSEPAPEDHWKGAKGFIHEVVYRAHLANHPSPQECEYYLCGPPLMTRAVFAMLDELGVKRETIFNDDFGV